MFTLGLRRWLRSQFVDSHTWRDVDLEHWWQMPDDDSRTASPWLQLAVDQVTRATFSEWHEKVAEERVRHYDRLRPYATRAVLLTVIVAGLGVLQAEWWCWLMVMPALLQVALEIYLHRFVHETLDDPRWVVVRWMRDIADSHHRTKLLNVTGMLGTLACPLNVLAISLGPPGGDLGWVKVVAFATAIFYLNSGLSSVFLDPANFTETSTMPPVMHRIRPYAPLLSLCSVLAMVGIGTYFDRWTSATAPLGYAGSALTLLLGSAVRNHDRVVAAAAAIGRQAVIAGRRELGRVVHDDLNGAKAAVESVRQVPGVEYRDSVELAALEAFLTHFSTRVDIDAGLTLSLTDLVEKIASPYGLGPSDIRCDIGWPSDIRRENHAIAVRMTTALVHNALQALNEVANLDVPRSISVSGSTTGSSHTLRYHLAVGDCLPPIAADRWCAQGTTLAALSEWLSDTFNGVLDQEVLGNGTKRIVASWYDRPPVRGYQGQDVSKEDP
ncbi:hypothetical protein A5746_07820 [Mycolicibacterium conceptionense]|uniref:hypothetical protein n=1 Tax=Mycolicibacterium conceptionense TaxID=451644 RepID=UPI0007EE1E27|nr:hypothetical protein [Mycolicibacterium conceptionense]OBJ98318.1 hypothetical protein A5639_29525 [Mycolicibacterium conceptionense]OMB78950.1 hypothetical protein A5746_07820 [Mycolicibacterium conceptionense]OMB83947.1 hypothetical protein A5741_21225 [Mycolicibacterium conceptionense]